MWAGPLSALFAVSTGLAPYVDSSTARAIAAKERRTFLKHLGEDGQGLDAEWLSAWVGEARVTPRMRTPLECELIAG